MKHACSSDDSFTSVHEPCNKHFTKCLMCAMLSTKWVTHGSGLNVRRGVRLCAAGAVQVRHTFSQRTRALSVGKTPSFSFCQVDMYVYDYGFPMKTLKNIWFFLVFLNLYIMYF